MDYIDLLNNLDSNKLKNINLIQVEDKYFLDLAIKSLKKDFIGEEFLDFNFERLDFEKLTSDKYESCVETLPLMSDRRLVIIDNCDLNRDSLKKYEEILDVMQKSFDDFNSMTYLFLIYESEKVFKGKFVKSIDKNGDIYNFSRLDKRQFYRFIKKYFLSNKIKLDDKSTSLIADRLRYLDKDANRTLYDIENELSKLANNIKSNTPSYDEIEESIIDTFEEKIFGLLDYMSTKDATKALNAFHTMKNEDVAMIYYMIIRQIRNMICVKDCVQKRINPQTSQNYCGLKSFEYGKLERFISKYKMSDLLYLHHLCFESEKYIKTSKRTFYEVIERIILAFCVGV
ncbi:DNA polymerase III subunit delta [Helcococcus kunzii]|uniref:DNA polymerase III subunit delta n=1 Tax=Helcococcus kunzii TaxID=40091 RepID=UPI0024AD316D|nr:hypothetical protein [Helcococcus kunzii]